MIGSKNEKLKFLTACLLLAFGLLSGLQVLELRAEEPRRAVVAMEMLFNKQYIVPTLHHWTYYNKPPLFNWILACFFKLFGCFDEWVVRLPGIVSLLATASVLFTIAKRHLNEKTALFAVLMFLTTGDLLFYGSVNSGEIDLFFTLLIMVQAWAIFEYSQKRKWLWMFVVSYCLTSLSFLTKGLPALTFQAFTLFGWLIATKNWKSLFSLQHLAGIMCFALVTGLYLLAYQQKQPLEPFLISLLKDATQKSAAESAVLDVLFNLLNFPLKFLILLMPWSLVLFFFYKNYHTFYWKKEGLIYFSIIFILANALIYWISPDTRNRYLYPFLPLCTLFLAYVASHWRVVKTNSILNLAILLAVLRIIYNFTLMPLQQEKLQSGLIYREHCYKMLEITGNAPIFLTGIPDTIYQKPLLGTKAILEAQILTPPMIPFQIPYYLSKGSRAVMRFDPKPSPDQYYLTYREFADQMHAIELYSFQEQWLKREMVLVKL